MRVTPELMRRYQASLLEPYQEAAIGRQLDALERLSEKRAKRLTEQEQANQLQSQREAQGWGTF